MALLHLSLGGNGLWLALGLHHVDQYTDRNQREQQRLLAFPEFGNSATSCGRSPIS